jgi:hypothetical protein
MTIRAQIRLILHGAIVLLGGMLSGVPLAVAIVDDWGRDAVRAWAVTHSSLVSAGVLLLALGAAGSHLVLAPGRASLLVRAMVGSTYVLCVGLVVSAATGLRGLTPGGAALNTVLHIANVVGVLGALVAGVVLVHGAVAALRRETRSPSAIGALGQEAAPRRV